MNSQETVIQLRELKLKGMADAFESIISLPVQNRPTMEATIARLAEAEAQDRRNRKTEMYLKTSRLRYIALIEDIICGTDRNFTKDDLAALADCSFIRRHENLLIQGKCGCGKSFLACALGRQACMLGYRTAYLNMNSFVEKVALSKLDGTFLKMITSLERNDLLILDDFGLQPMDTNTRLAMLQILEERYERKSVIIVSQLPIKNSYLCTQLGRADELGTVCSDTCGTDCSASMVPITVIHLVPIQRYQQLVNCELSRRTLLASNSSASGPVRSSCD